MRSRQEVMERVAEANAQFYSAIENGDIDLMRSVWAEEHEAPDLVCVNPGWPLLRGRTEIMRAWSLIMANVTYIQYVLTETHIGVGGDIAMVTCEENVLTAEDGNPGFIAGGQVVTTNLFVDTAQGWRLWSHHASPVLMGDDEDEGGEE
ncbi:nuclear transport factor 2 family protein [Nocardiopsis changdeensis]|uniref:Nuclear transport factor 2 family protein n=1 Tax=Nocardiopsis changdeensis TaxID=2831969 RepID=A0ABX8BLU8_9ACTN|nr:MULTISPECIES: nuclear transport factor 2 family protein [Nocardiopsis]QUX22289.1 nuclear transport factor 2 family protein [Nocardiopsis changdeensis]QYX38230.1 nuclear transport factor 2 family protein [Nocardiopsis sp. MT53]